MRGTSVKIKVPTLVSCKTCSGSGAKPGTKPTTCSTCGGHGQVRMQQGFFSVQQTCPTCRGKGKTVSDPCSACHGHGRVEETKTLNVKVPAGVDSGDRIRLAGEGEAGADGGPSGDLYVQVAVRDHEFFQRDGRDLYCEVPIGIVEACLGGEIEVPTLDGRVKLKVPEGTQTGKLFRLRSKGVNFIACPSCSRQNFDVIKTVNELETRLEDLETSLDVAIIGCVVNGPGESREAHVGLAGGTPRNLVYVNGEPFDKFDNATLVDDLERLIRTRASAIAEAESALIAKAN